MADVKMLCTLLIFHRVQESKLLECKQTLAEYVKIVNAEKDLAPIVSSVSRNMKKKIIDAGLTMETIKKAYEKTVTWESLICCQKRMGRCALPNRKM